MSVKELKALLDAYHRNLKNYTFNTQTNQVEHLISAEEAAAGTQPEKIIKSPKKCPECHHHLIVILIEGIEAESCVYCQSLWLDNSELKAITGLSKDVPGDTLQHRKSKYKCPLCQESMNEYLFTQQGNILIDKCRNGHGVYLESDELRRILNLIDK
jgi:Zn-finger nucleic acid-binding protein